MKTSTFINKCPYVLYHNHIRRPAERNYVKTGGGILIPFLNLNWDKKNYILISSYTTGGKATIHDILEMYCLTSPVNEGIILQKYFSMLKYHHSIRKEKIIAKQLIRFIPKT